MSIVPTNQKYVEEHHLPQRRPLTDRDAGEALASNLSRLFLTPFATDVGLIVVLDHIYKALSQCQSVVCVCGSTCCRWAPAALVSSDANWTFAECGKEYCYSGGLGGPVRFKIDVSDRETGEVSTVEVDAPTAGAARHPFQQAGYMVWATEPLPDASAAPARRRASGSVTHDPLLDAARHGRFRAHPVRFVVAPVCRWVAGVSLWLAAAVQFLHWRLPSPYVAEASASNLVCACGLFWLAGKWIGWPLTRGRAAQRAWADKQVVCRYCRRRGNVRTAERGLLNRRLWGSCTKCGIRWPL